MADEKIIDEIKASIAVSRKRPMNFALCYGKRPDGTLLLFHRKKAPSILARQAKKEGETNKVAFGTVETKGKVLQMTLEEDPPAGLLRQGKLFFTNIGLGLKLKLMSADGTVLEADEDISEGDEVPENVETGPDNNEAQEDTVKAEPVDDPNAAKTWEAAFGKIDPLVASAATSQAPTADKILAAWTMAQDRAAARDFDAAMKIAAKLVPMLKEGSTPPGEATPADPDLEKWQKLEQALRPRVVDALKANHTEGTKIRAVWAFAQEKGETGSAATAIKAAQQLVELLKDGGHSSDAPPQNVVAFQRSRILWIDTKRAMRADLDSFRSAVADQSADDEAHAEIIASADQLVSEFDAFDTTLEDVLDSITQTKEGQERTALKRQAANAIGTYMSVLDSRFFKMIDDNPFTSVNVTARARQSLGAIQSTLA